MGVKYVSFIIKVFTSSKSSHETWIQSGKIFLAFWNSVCKFHLNRYFSIAFCSIYGASPRVTSHWRWRCYAPFPRKCNKIFANNDPNRFSNCIQFLRKKRLSMAPYNNIFPVLYNNIAKGSFKRPLFRSSSRERSDGSSQGPIRK